MLTDAAAASAAASAAVAREILLTQRSADVSSLHRGSMRMRTCLTICLKTKLLAYEAAFCCVTMSTKKPANSACESKKWALKQRLLKTKSEVFSLQSQLYKALAFYEEEKHSLKLQLNSLHEDLNALKRENDGLRSSLNHSQADLETFRKQERCDSMRRMHEIHQRRKAALQYHREEFERTHSDDKVTVAAENDKLHEDEIDGTLIAL